MWHARSQGHHIRDYCPSPGQSGLCIGLRLRKFTQFRAAVDTLCSVGLCNLRADASSNPHHGINGAMIQEHFEENEQGDSYIRYFRFAPGHP